MWAVAIILTAIADSNIMGGNGEKNENELFSSFLEPNNPNPCTFFKLWTTVWAELVHFKMSELN